MKCGSNVQPRNCLNIREMKLLLIGQEGGRMPYSDNCKSRGKVEKESVFYVLGMTKGGKKRLGKLLQE